MVTRSEYSFVTGTGAYAEDNARLGGLAIHFPQSRRRLSSHSAGHQQSIGMPRRANQFDTKPLNVKLRRQQIDNLDITIVARAGINVKNPRRLL